MDEVALVTGAARGIGRAVAEGLAARGMTVVIGCRDLGRADAVAAEITSAGPGRAEAVLLDVTDPATASGAARQIADRHGRLDVLVNNAGIPGDIDLQTPGTTDVDVLRAVFATNVFGAVVVTEALLPLLRAATGARIVNVSSSVGSLARMSAPDHYFAALPGNLGYAPSKTALNQVTVQYAKHLRGDGILVNAADPGPCATDLTLAVRHRVPDLHRTAVDGAAIVVQLATLPPTGPTGQYIADAGPVPW